MKTVFNALNFNSWVGEPKLSFGLYRNSIAKFWGKIKVFGLRCCISSQRFLFTNRLWPLSNVHSFGGRLEREEAKPTSLFFPLNSTQGAISAKPQQARCVAPGVKGRWNYLWGKTFLFAVLVVVSVVDRKHFLLISATTALGPWCWGRSRPLPPSSFSASPSLPAPLAFGVFPQRPPQHSLNHSPTPTPHHNSTVSEERRGVKGGTN